MKRSVSIAKDNFSLRGIHKLSTRKAELNRQPIPTTTHLAQSIGMIHSKATGE